MKEVVVLIDSGSIGQTIARRVGAGKHVVLGDLRQEAAENAANLKLIEQRPKIWQNKKSCQCGRSFTITSTG